MSMLAEPRRKQRWSLNPRGKQWSDDSNKFGQRMLEKMGWSSGKGLGANEQGATEHVRVKVKNDTLGIGFNENLMDKAWTEHQEGFNEILQQLQRSQDSEIINVTEKNGELSGKSLELKSKQSKARVHYQKFTRGKDINKYSTKDLANIFGQKDLNEKSIPNEMEKYQKVSVNAVGSETYESGVVTIYRGSMADYFKSKIPNYTVNSNKENVEKTNSSEDESLHYRGFGFSEAKVVDNEFSNSGAENTKSNNCAFDNPCLNLNDSVNSSVHNQDEEQPKTLRPSIKRKKEFSYENEGLDLNSSERTSHTKRLKRDVHENGNKGAFVNNALDLESQTDERHIGREFEVPRPDSQLANKSLNSLNGKNKDYISSEQNVSNTDSAKKKKKKAKITESGDSGFINTALDLESQTDERHIGREFEVPRPDSQLANKSLNSLNGKNKDYISSEQNVSNTDSAKKKKKKTKITESGDSGFINTALDLESQTDERHIGREFEVPRSDSQLANKSLNSSDGKNKHYASSEHNISNTDSAKKKKKVKITESGDSGFINIALDLESQTDEKHNGKEFEVPRPQSNLPNAPALASENDNNKVVLNNQITSDTNVKRNKRKITATNVCDNQNADDNHNGKDLEIPKFHIGIANKALDITDESSKKRRVTFNDQVEYSVDLTNKKKVKGKLDKFEVENNKLKKKKKKKAQIENSGTIGFVNGALDIEILSEEINDNAVNEYRSKKMKKKKDRRLSNLETIEEAPEEDQELLRVDGSEIKVEPLDEIPNKTNGDSTTSREDLKENKERKIKEKGNKSIEPVTVVDITGDEEEVVNYEKKEKKKEKKEKEQQPTVVDITGDEEEDIKYEKKKKKKKHSKKDEGEIIKVKPKYAEEILNLQKEPINEHGVDDVPKKKKKRKHLKENTNLSEEDAPRNEEKIKKEKHCKDEINEEEVSMSQNNDTLTNNFRKGTEDLKNEVTANHSKHSKGEEESPMRNVSFNRKSGTWADSKVESTLTFSKFSPGATNINRGSVSFSQRNNRRLNIRAANNSGSGRVRMTKMVLKRLFHSRAILEFPGSNLMDIKGYGVDAEGTIQS